MQTFTISLTFPESCDISAEGIHERLQEIAQELLYETAPSDEEANRYSTTVDSLVIVTTEEAQ